VPVESIFEARGNAWKEWGYSTDLCCLTASAYVDNIFSVGKDLPSAIAIQEDFEYQLQRMWGQAIKPDSRSCLVPKGGPLGQRDVSRWPLVKDLECLGHILQHDGETHRAWNHARRIMWKTFFAQAKSSDVATKLPVDVLVSNLNRAVTPGLLYRMKVFPVTQLRLQQVDLEQRKCIASILRTKLQPGEEILSFCRRKNKLSSNVIRQTGKWSSSVAEQTVKWHAHLQRNNCKVLWPTLLEPTRDETWLWFRRAANSTRWHSRTATRAFRGNVAQRWAAGVKHATAHLEHFPIVPKSKANRNKLTRATL
jgi:hypothetical protein